MTADPGEDLADLQRMGQGLGGLPFHEIHDRKPVGAGHHERIVRVANDAGQLLLENRVQQLDRLVDI